MIFDGLIFDLDGTLWDSSLAVRIAWNTAIKTDSSPSRDFTHDDIAGIMGLPMGKIFEKLLPNCSSSQRDAIASKCFSEELAVIRNVGAHIYPGVAEGLATLSSVYPLFVVSNCNTEYLLLFLQISGLGNYFTDSECYGNTGKPKAENIRSVIQRNRLRQTAYIADTSADEESAKSAGATYFHVNYGFGSPSTQCVRFDQFDQLVDHFLPRANQKG